MHWDWTINAGNVIAAIVLLAGFLTAHIQNVRNLQEIKTKLGLIYKWFEHRIMRDVRPD